MHLSHLNCLHGKVFHENQILKWEFFFFFFLSKFTFGFDGKGKILGRDKSYHGK